MADKDSSSNTAIVAIVVLFIVAIGLAYFFGFFGPRQGDTKIIKKPTTIEQPFRIRPDK